MTCGTASVSPSAGSAPWFKAALACAGAALLTNPAGAAPGASPQECSAVKDIALVNGKIITGDPQSRIVSSLRIIGDKIVQVGDGVLSSGACTQTIDLGGRSVIPGLIDAHTHLVVMSQWPGIQMMAMENARDIASLQMIVAHEAKRAPKGAWLSAMGMWLRGQFVENRLPTLAELDTAAPSNPVLLYDNNSGNAQSF